jgi:hypothetical protein
VRRVVLSIVAVLLAVGVVSAVTRSWYTSYVAIAGACIVAVVIGGFIWRENR